MAGRVLVSRCGKEFEGVEVIGNTIEELAAVDLDFVEEIGNKRDEEAPVGCILFCAEGIEGEAENGDIIEEMGAADLDFEDEIEFGLDEEDPGGGFVEWCRERNRYESDWKGYCKHYSEYMKKANALLE